MNDHNQCNFIGRLGQNPDLKSLPSGDPVCNFSVACGWKSKKAEGTEWINAVAFNRLAEICGEYLKKGSKVFISGQLRTRKWQDKEGNDKYKTEVVIRDMQMLDSKKDSQQLSEGQASQQFQAPAPAGGELNDEIPFAQLGTWE